MPIVCLYPSLSGLGTSLAATPSLTAVSATACASYLSNLPESSLMKERSHLFHFDF